MIRFLKTNSLLCSRDPNSSSQMQKEPGGRHLSPVVLYAESSLKQTGSEGGGGGLAVMMGESTAACLGWSSHGDGFKLLGIFSSQNLLSAHQKARSTQGRAGVMLLGGWQG